jgi:hypothetical protein
MQLSVFCNFGEWRRSVLHLGMCLAAYGNLSSIEMAACKKLCHGRCDGLADNALGIGSGWRQSKQNQTPLAAIRSWDGVWYQHNCQALRMPTNVVALRNNPIADHIREPSMSISFNSQSELYSPDSIVARERMPKFLGLLRNLNPGPLAPEARIMPLDQAAKCL